MAETSPLLMEHQAPNDLNTAAPANYDAPEAERRLARRIDKLYKEAKKARELYDRNWLDYYKMFRGKQWKNIRPSYRASEVFNMIFQIIQSQVPILTDTKPKFEYLPTEPSDREFADLMNDIAASDWEKGNFLYKLTEMIYDAHFYGTALAYLGWDPDADFGAGEICFKPDEIFFAFPDPDCGEINSGEYFIHAQARRVAKLKKEYPDKAPFIKPDVTDILNASKNDLNSIRALAPTSGNQTIEGSTFQWPDNSADKAIEIICFSKDGETETQEVNDPETGNLAYETKLKFPKGRKTVMTGGVILEDRENPYSHAKFPYLKLVNYMLPHEFWGVSEIEPIQGPQKLFNKIISYVVDVLSLTGNPIWIVDANSGVDGEELLNRPGMVLEKNPGTEVRRESGAQLQPYVIQIINQIKEWMDQIAGSQDITRGVSAPGVTAASAIDSLQNAAQTRIRQKSRNIDKVLNDFGDMYQSLVLQFYTAPRVYRLTNQDGSFRYFKSYFFVDTEGKTRARVQRYGENGATLPGFDEYILSGKLDLRVSTGSSLSFSKAARKDELLSYFDRGIIDAEEVLKGADYPNWEAVLSRMDQKAQAQAQAQAQASQK